MKGGGLAHSLRLSGVDLVKLSLPGAVPVPESIHCPSLSDVLIEWYCQSPGRVESRGMVSEAVMNSFGMHRHPIGRRMDQGEYSREDLKPTVG